MDRLLRPFVFDCLCLAGTPQQATRHLLQFLSKQEVKRLKGFDHENGFRGR